MDICPKCGLPNQACVCEVMSKSSDQRIKISTVKKQYGKLSTIVSGFGDGVNIKTLAKTLKNELACGGTTKNNEIELQGDHRKRLKEILVREGFDENSIEN